MYVTEVGKWLPNNYILGYFLDVRFDKKKPQTTLLTKGSLNPIIYCLNISTFDNAFSAKNRKSRSVKHDSIYAFCKVIKTATYLYLMRR